MKISEEQLKKIIQEELSSALKEGEIDENFLKKAAGSLGGFFKGLTRDPTTDTKKLGSFVNQRDRSMPSDKQKPGITKFTQGPSNEPVQSRPTTSATTPSASGATTQTAGPGETATTATTQPATDQPPQSQPEKSKLKVNILSPVESEPEEKPSAQMDFFTDLAPKIKKDEELKQTWQKMFDSAKKEPNQMKALERLKAIADSSQAHPDIKKQAKQLVDRYLNESKNKTYNKTYNKWQKIIKG